MSPDSRPVRLRLPNADSVKHSEPAFCARSLVESAYPRYDAGTMSTRLSDPELLAKLVGFDTTSHKSNMSLAEFICDYLDHPDISLTRYVDADNVKTNVVALLRGARRDNPDRLGLVLSGHMDVVPALEPGWQSEPFTLTERESGYAGRGACDMKGSVALAMNLALEAAGRQLTHPLVLIFTYDEEVGSLGALRVAEDWNDEFVLPRSAIIGEPTSLRVIRMHKGHLKMRATFRGRGAHSGYPHLGVNAIEPAARVIQSLVLLRKKLETEQTEVSRFFPETPFVALNIAQIAGGEAINIVPDFCRVDIGLRLLPGMASEAGVARIRQAIEAVAERGDCEVAVVHDNPPMLLAEDTTTNRRVCQLVSQRESYGVSYASDAGILQRMGMECLLFGPGNIEVAHKPNEYMPKAEFAQARQALKRIISAFCD